MTLYRDCLVSAVPGAAVLSGSISRDRPDSAPAAKGISSGTTFGCEDPSQCACTAGIRQGQQLRGRQDRHGAERGQGQEVEITRDDE